MKFDSATVAAFVDGELDDLTARRIEREAESDTALAAEIARHRGLKAQLTAHFGPVADEAAPERLRALLIDSKVDTSLTERREAKRAHVSMVHWGAVAASLALALTIGLRPWAPRVDVTETNGVLVASGALADALDSQLASNQAGDAAVRIGLSFRDKDGRYCRSFETGEFAGIGCHDKDGWTLERTLRGQKTREYRQAASGPLAADAASMMEGHPLDAAAERKARDRRWQ